MKYDSSRRTQPIILSEFMESITHASGYAWQMIHVQKDMKWAIIRDTLDMIKELTPAIAVGKTTYGT